MADNPWADSTLGLGVTGSLPPSGADSGLPPGWHYDPVSGVPVKDDKATTNHPAVLLTAESDGSLLDTNGNQLRSPGTYTPGYHLNYDPDTGSITTPSGVIQPKAAPTGGGGGGGGGSTAPSQAGRYQPLTDTDGSATGIPGAHYIWDSQDGSISNVVKPAAAPATLDSKKDLNGDGYDDTTGLPVGVVRDSNSPSGYFYQGKAVNPDGSLYSGGVKTDTPTLKNTTSQTVNGVKYYFNDAGEVVGTQQPGKSVVWNSSSGAGSAGGGGVDSNQPNMGQGVANTGYTPNGPQFGPTGYVPYPVTQSANGAFIFSGDGPGGSSAAYNGGGSGGGVAAPGQDLTNGQLAQLNAKLQLAAQKEREAWQAAENAKDRSITERQNAIQNALQATQLKNQAAKDLSTAISTADPLAHAIMLANAGDINNLSNLSNITNNNVGTIDAAIRNGGTALSNAAILPGAQLQDQINQLNAFLGGGQLPGLPGAGGTGGGGGLPGTGGTGTPGTGDTGGTGGGAGQPGGNWWEQMGKRRPDISPTAGDNTYGGSAFLGGYKMGSDGNMYGPAVILGADGLPTGYKQGSKTVTDAGVGALPTYQSSSPLLPGYLDPRTYDINTGTYKTPTAPKVTPAPAAVLPGISADTAASGGVPGGQTYPQAVANTSVAPSAFGPNPPDPRLPQMAKGSDGWIDAPKQAIIGDPQQPGVENPELTQIKGDDVKLKVTPLNDFWGMPASSPAGGVSGNASGFRPPNLGPLVDNGGTAMHQPQMPNWGGFHMPPPGVGYLPFIQHYLQSLQNRGGQQGGVLQHQFPRQPITQPQPGGPIMLANGTQGIPAYGGGTRSGGGPTFAAPPPTTSPTAATPPNPTTSTPQGSAPPPAQLPGMQFPISTTAGGSSGVPNYNPLGGATSASTQQITDLRQNTPQLSGVNPFDVSWNNLDPAIQQAFYQARQDKYGVPLASQQWEQNHYALQGLPYHPYQPAQNFSY